MTHECNEGHIAIIYGSQPCPLCACFKKIVALKEQRRKSYEKGRQDERTFTLELLDTIASQMDEKFPRTLSPKLREFAKKMTTNTVNALKAMIQSEREAT